MLSQVLLSSGCTNIDTPVRDAANSEDSYSTLTVHCERSIILDTEPFALTAEGGQGLIFWRCVPDMGQCFQPQTGKHVLFIPPDITGEQSVAIFAEDERGSSAPVHIKIMDEGEPPAPGDIIINEIAWSGTLTSASDEYIELLNTSDRPFYLNNWRIERAGGSDAPLGFSGRIEPAAVFLIANYVEGSEKTAISCAIQYSNTSLSLPNRAFGPFVLINGQGMTMDCVGDGGNYTHGINVPDVRSSASRHTWSGEIQWSPESWYTESQSVNLDDGTLGTPGAVNSDLPLQEGPNAEDASAILTEYAVDPVDDIGEDWAEIHITVSGTLANFTLTDLDGDDRPITCGRDIQAVEGEYYLVIWHDYDDDYDFESNGYIIDGNCIFIPDNPPTGTKDQIVLLCGSHFLDGLCYYTDGNDFFDNDEQQMRDYGWLEDPILGKYAAKYRDSDGKYVNYLISDSWVTDTLPSPGSSN